MLPMKHPSCFLLESRTEVKRVERDDEAVSVDKTSNEVSGKSKAVALRMARKNKPQGTMRRGRERGRIAPEWREDEADSPMQDGAVCEMSRGTPGRFHPCGPALAETCAVGVVDVRGPSVLATSRSV